MNEFQLIKKYFQSRLVQRNDIIVNSGDDCAVIALLPDQQLALSMDTLVEGHHFSKNTDPKTIGHKALAVNLSDLAACGAKPSFVTMALTLPHIDEKWIAEFCEGFFSLADCYRVALVGGNVTKGPLTITVQAHGTTSNNEVLLRSGAKIHDNIYVTGTVGDAALALSPLYTALNLNQQSFIKNRLDKPDPRVTVGLTIKSFAHACIDISDGLLADLQHILTQSQVGAVLDLSKVPLSSALLSLQREKIMPYALTGGDDYELCFTANAADEKKIARIAQETGVAITAIGKIIKSDAPGFFDQKGNAIQYSTMGFQHFTQKTLHC